jgi:hypothetical protein
MSKSTCNVTDCDKPVLAKALCRNHYSRLKRNGSFDYLQAPIDRSADTESHKVCSKCNELTSRGNFYKKSRSLDGLRGECKDCTNARNKARYEENREDVLAKQRARNETESRKAYIEAYRKEYYEANRFAFAERAHAKRARRNDALVDEGITVSSLRKRHGDNCVFCGVVLLFERQAKGHYHPQRASMEHMLPLARGGEHSWENVRLACLGCNLSKNQKTAEEFLIFREKQLEEAA